MATFADVKKQIANLEKKAAELRKAEIAKIIATIKRQIAEYDLTAADLGLAGGPRAAVTAKARAPKPKRPKAPPKYMDPKTSKTWNGHGKAPLWIAEATKKGRRDDFLIERVLAKQGEKAAVKPKKAAPAKAAVKNAKAVAASAAKKPAVKAAARKPVVRAAKKPVVKAAPAPAPAAAATDEAPAAAS